LFDRFELDELLTNYQRVRSNLLSCKKQYDSVRMKIDTLQVGRTFKNTHCFVSSATSLLFFRRWERNFLAQFHGSVLRRHVYVYQDQLWILSKEKLEEEGECEDGTQVKLILKVKTLDPLPDQNYIFPSCVICQAYFSYTF
jgi:hypothetical protein